MRRRSPQPLAYGGGGGPGSASNLIMALFLNRADLKMTSVSYRGTAPALTDVIGGQIPTTFVPISEAVAQATNPNIRILAVSSEKRSARLPDVPSIAETYPGYNAVSWTGMLAPKGTPKAIIDKLAGEMARAAQRPEVHRAASRQRHRSGHRGSGEIRRPDRRRNPELGQGGRDRRSQDRAVAHHCSAMLASRMTLPQRTISVLIHCANSSGVLATGSKPIVASFSRVSGIDITFTVSR